MSLAHGPPVLWPQVLGHGGVSFPSPWTKDKRASGTTRGLLRYMFINVTLSLSHVPLGKVSHMASPEVKGQGGTSPLGRGHVQFVELGRGEGVNQQFCTRKKVISEVGPQAWRGPEGRWQAEISRWRELGTGGMAGWQWQKTQKELET